VRQSTGAAGLSRRNAGNSVSAFEVRHLVEHTNGKVDGQFVNAAASSPLWQNSTWHDVRLAEGGSVPIRERDFEDTCDAMLASARWIADEVKTFSP
jgi:hypothetical protein